MPLLETSDVTVRFGGLVAVDAFSMSVETGSLVGLIGPNGAGKTTFIDAVSGFTPHSGEVRFSGEALGRIPPHERARRGLLRTFQSVELFRDLNVADNLRVHREHAPGEGVPDDDSVMWALEQLELGWSADLMPSELPHGTRRLVGIARSLVSRPKLLLLDESGAGLDAAETRDLARRLRRLVDEEITSLLLIDHDMDLVLSICDRVYVLNFGEPIAEGTPKEIRNDPDVVSAYLGGGTPVHTEDSARQGATTSEELLTIHGLTTGYEGVPVVRDVDLEVRAGEIVALLGPNGAGKTTTLSTVSGLLSPMSGDVRFRGASIVSTPAHRITKLGISHVPEDRALVYGLTAKDNLRLAERDGGHSDIDVLELFPEVRERLEMRAGLLSGGEQQMLAVARALAGAPQVLMVDEMSLGLAPVIVERLFEALREIADRHGVGILLVEQHVQLALELADRAYVLARGTIRAHGTAAEIAQRWDDIEATYLGSGDDGETPQ